jgi:HEAT repeat protein
MRSSAASALGNLKAQQAIPSLLLLLRDNNFDVRSSAAEALGNLKVQQAIPQLLLSLQDNGLIGRSNAVNAAQALGNLKVQQAIPPLLLLLQDNDSSMRSSAAEALGKLQVKQVIPFLLDELKNGEKFAAITLSRMSEQSTELTQWQNQQQQLLKEQLNNNQITKAELADELGSIYTQTSVKQLIELLNDKNNRVIENALISLANIGEYHPQWLQTNLQQLIQFSNHQDWFIRKASIQALGKLVLSKNINKIKDPTVNQRGQSNLITQNQIVVIQNRTQGVKNNN